eukprot:CAMPEP_0195286410 /NCGR_PEP_ID=MMETSP0707-20130614/3884_1 /TAXON_ID=33640 /ORGANISM="Asterionellopsis glacialis, Strain CCMP134" /LENGTH=579 /DNA_ID=CAMNT_0040346045 /DNA_START=118 /DNA_END=1857 /DNA_ORIENTATION=+
MKAIASCCTILLIMVCHCAAQASPKRMLRRKQKQPGSIKPLEKHTGYDMAQPYFDGKRTGLLHFNFNNLADIDILYVQLFADEHMLAFTKQEADAVAADGNTYWFGVSGNSTMNVIDMGWDEEAGHSQIYASVNTGDKIYHISPNHVLSEVVETYTEDYLDEVEPLREDGTEDIPEDLDIFDNADGRHLQQVKPSQIDVMVVWTRRAECRNSNMNQNCNVDGNTRNNMMALVNLAVAETNTAFQQSGVVHRLRLVHAYRHKTYSEQNMQKSLQDLQGGRSALDDVAGNRETFGADVVAMITDDRDACGVAYFGPSRSHAFSVSSWNCATGYYSFGHEIGHNLGCNHDRAAAGQCSNNAQTNFGYRDPSGDFRSIMSYSCTRAGCPNHSQKNCPRVQFFSNPNAKYGNQRIGTARDNNAAQINAAGETVANFYNAPGQGPPTILRAPPAPAPAPTTPAPTTPAPPTPAPGSKCNGADKNECKDLKKEGCKWKNGKCFNKNAPPPPPPTTPANPPPPPPPPPTTPANPPTTPTPATNQNQNTGGGGGGNTSNICSQQPDKNACKGLKKEGCKWKKNACLQK